MGNPVIYHLKGLTYEGEGHAPLLPEHGGLGLVVPLAPLQWVLAPYPPHL